MACDDRVLVTTSTIAMVSWSGLPDDLIRIIVDLAYTVSNRNQLVQVNRQFLTLVDQISIVRGHGRRANILRPGGQMILTTTMFRNIDTYLAETVRRTSLNRAIDNQIASRQGKFSIRKYWRGSPARRKTLCHEAFCEIQQDAIDHLNRQYGNTLRLILRFLLDAAAIVHRQWITSGQAVAHQENFRQLHYAIQMFHLRTLPQLVQIAEAIAAGKLANLPECPIIHALSLAKVYWHQDQMNDRDSDMDDLVRQIC